MAAEVGVGKEVGLGEAGVVEEVVQASEDCSDVRTPIHPVGLDEGCASEVLVEDWAGCCRERAFNGMIQSHVYGLGPPADGGSPPPAAMGARTSSPSSARPPHSSRASRPLLHSLSLPAPLLARLPPSSSPPPHFPGPSAYTLSTGLLSSAPLFYPPCLRRTSCSCVRASWWHLLPPLAGQPACASSCRSFNRHPA